MAIRSFLPLLLVTAAGWPRPTGGARVLAFETAVAKSHWNFMRAVLHALADGGHRVTAYTPFPDPGPPRANYTEVDVYADFGEHMAVVDMDATVIGQLFTSPGFLVPFMGDYTLRVCDIMDRLLADRGGDGDGFDVFVTEPLTTECVSRAARRLGVPLVYTVPAPLLPWVETAMFGHRANPSHVPHLMSPYAVPDTFRRRMDNLRLHLYTVYLHYRWYATSAAAAGTQPPRPVRPSLVFANTHHITEPPRPAPPNRVDVGGIHLKAPEPLPSVSTV